jgi:dipeptidyl-peptidase 4
MSNYRNSFAAFRSKKMRHESGTFPSFPIEEVARLPLPGMAIPGALAFSPDGRWISYLFSPEGGLARQLYKFDPESGEASLLAAPADGGASEENLSAEEKLRRERMRQHELGMTAYAWAPVGERLMAPLPDGLYIQEGTKGSLRKIAGSEAGAILDPQFSPDGEWVAFVQGGEVFAMNISGGTPRQLTHRASAAGKTHGLAEFIAQEEMGRFHGFWWAPDSRKIAFTEVDETHIPIYRIVHQGKDVTGPDAQEDHHYPFAGRENARVRLGVVSLDGAGDSSHSEPVWMDLGADEDIYLARVDWLPSGTLTAQIENRAQSELSLVSLDPASGKRETILVETNPVWINLHDMFKPLQNGQFLWASERSGFRHLYLYEGDGRLIHQLTQGDWMVDGLAGVDEVSQTAYFTATKDNPLESHLYSVSLAAGEVTRISQAAGMHTVVLDLKHGRYLDTHEALDQAPMLTLRALRDGSLLQTIYTPADPRIADLGLQAPEIVTLKSRDGALLYGALYKPPAEYGPGPFPTIVNVYGGPHVQLVANSWKPTMNLRAQYLRNLGFLVFTLDNRGSARRGLAFEGAIRHHLGDLEVRDQVDGVNWLVAQGLADPGRVGMIGWSYGGYMSLMCLLRASETFQAVVAGAPVSAFDGYDTHYTERYMGTPQSNPEGYWLGSPLAHVENMRGRLLLVHGLIDENVHFRHTARLINALIRARKPYELMLFPDERHGPRRSEDRVYLEERIRNFFSEVFTDDE